jgi:hypothetical protein
MVRFGVAGQAVCRVPRVGVGARAMGRRPRLMRWAGVALQAELAQLLLLCRRQFRS